MQEITLNTIVDLVGNEPIVAYKTSKGEVMKLQKTGKEQWIFANLTLGDQYLGVNNTIDWANRDFTTSQRAIKSILNKFPSISMYKFDSWVECIGWMGGFINVS